MTQEVVAGGRRGPGSSAATAAGARSPVAGTLPGRAPRWRTQTGAVTAEAATVLPLLVAFALGMVWVLAVAVAQVRVVDGARAAARAAARGDSDGAAVAAGEQVAPAGATFAVSRSGRQVVVTAVAEVHGPGGLFAHVPGLRVSSRAVAVEEPQ